MKGWRTLAFNVLSLVGIILAGSIEYLAGENTWAQPLGEWSGAALAVVNIANIALRAITTTPIGKCSQPSSPPSSTP